MKPKQVKQLIETAVENPLTTPPIMEWGAPGIGKCLEPNSRVLTPNGWYPIKNIRTGGMVMGISPDGVLSSTEVLAEYRTQVRSFCLVETVKSSVLCSLEHKFLTPDGWVEAGHLTETSHIIALEQEVKYGMELNPKALDSGRRGEVTKLVGAGPESNRDCCRVKQNSDGSDQEKVAEPSLSKPKYRDVALASRSFQTYLEAPTNHPGASLSSWDSRWRRNHQFFSGQFAIVNSPNGICDQYISRVNKISNGDSGLVTNRRQEEIQVRELYSAVPKGFKNRRPLKGTFAFPYNQKEFGRDDNRVYRIAKQKINRVTIFGAGNTFNAQSKKAEQLPRRISESLEALIEQSRTTQFYDISTSFGNYIAEWFVVHNSAIPRQVAREKGIGFVDIRGPQLDPTDLRGIPAIVKVPCSCGSKKDCLLCGGIGYTEKAKWLAPTFLPTEGKGILFLDELPSAPPLVQASMYQLVLDRAIGEYILPDGWYIIAAGNRIEDRAVSYRMPTALANRFTHIDPFETDLDNWVEWATRAGINPNIISFLRFKPELLWQFKPESSEKAFPSPRSWEFASRWVKSCPPRLLAAVLEGTIGKGATAEFVSFLKVQTELPDIDTILTGKSDFWPEKRMDLKYALIAALATHAKGITQFERMLNYSEKLDEEFAVLLITMLAVKDEGAMASTASFPKWSRKHADIIITSRKI